MGLSDNLLIIKLVFLTILKRTLKTNEKFVVSFMLPVQEGLHKPDLYMIYDRWLKINSFQYTETERCYLTKIKFLHFSAKTLFFYEFML